MMETPVLKCKFYYTRPCHNQRASIPTSVPGACTASSFFEIMFLEAWYLSISIPMRSNLRLDVQATKIVSRSSSVVVNARPSDI